MKHDDPIDSALEQQMLDELDEAQAPLLEGELEAAAAEVVPDQNNDRREKLRRFLARRDQDSSPRQGDADSTNNQGGGRGQKVRALLIKYREQGAESLNDEERRLLRRMIMLRRQNQGNDNNRAGAGQAPRKEIEQLRAKIAERRSGGEEFTPAQREKLRQLLLRRRQNNE